MNADTFDMSTPITRGELREELALFEIRFEQKLDHKLDQKLDERLGELEQKFDHKLEMWGGALLARMTESEQRSAESEQRLLTELGRHARAIQEAMTAQISVIDETYADLPGRVRRLEAKVFTTRRR